MNFWWKRVDGWISGFSENGEFLKLKKPVSSHFSFIGLYWYIEICTYLMHTFWWISAHTCTCETISAIRVMSISITSKRFLETCFFFFFFFMVMLVKLSLCSLVLNRNAESFGKWKRMALWLCQAEGQANALKTVCLPWRGQWGVYEVQRTGRGQLVDTLLIGWWWGNQESASLTFCWGLHACGQHAGNFSHLVGLSVSAKQLKGHDNIIYRTSGRIYRPDFV